MDRGRVLGRAFHVWGMGTTGDSVLLYMKERRRWKEMNWRREQRTFFYKGGREVVINKKSIRGNIGV